MLKKQSGVVYSSIRQIYTHTRRNFAINLGGGDKPGLKVPKLGGLGKSAPLIDESINGKHYDVAVIGGGSGGLGFAFEAAKLGLNTIVFDFVEPSTQGNKWGLGGTCVNVGCIPKKLFHTAALHKEGIINAYDFGWDLGELNSSLLMDPENPKDQLFEQFKWEMLVKNVQMHIKSLNFEYKSTCAESNIPYVNALAALGDKNTVVFSPKKEALVKHLETKSKESNPKEVGKVTADHIVIATGGRPNLLTDEECKNARAISLTSDDIFFHKTPPKKTLVVGGGYIAVECAGFLRTIGYPVTLMTRSIYLRSFDRDVVHYLLDFLKEDQKMNVIGDSLPYEMQRQPNGRVLVKWRNKKKENFEDEFDTVLMAIGRYGLAPYLGLENAGVKYNHKNGKILGGFGGEAEKTSVDNIYALGDILEGIPELTPIAKNSGRLLAHRLSMLKLGNVDKKKYESYKMDYTDYPTTIFSPIEFSTVGLSEEQARKRFGDQNIEVYHSRLIPLEESLVSRVNEVGETKKRKAYFKIVVNKNENEKVLGMHYLGPNAGEVMQGFSVAMKLGVTKADLDRTVGIHPTVAEEFCLLKKTKNEDPDKSSC